MIRPRWNKVLSDLWSHKARSLLVIASIAVGLFAIGIIATLQTVISEDMANGYAAVNPANIQVEAQLFGQDEVERVQKMEGVREAEGVRTLTLRLEASPGEWVNIDIKAVDDYEESTIDQVHLEQGAWPPQEKEIVIERFKWPDAHAQIGDMVTLELPSGKTRQVKVVGVVHDQTIGAFASAGGFFLAPMQGYITLDTLEWLEQPRLFNQLHATVEGDSRDEVYLREMADQVREELENSGRMIYNTGTRGAYDHPNRTYVDAIAGVLYLLGFLVVFLSGFLITNTLSALLNQQVQQIGVMKTVGARRFQVIGIYTSLIFVFGVLAFLLAAPLSDRFSYQLLGFLAREINFRVQGYRVIYGVLGLQLMLALVVPQVAGFLPIYQGARISVQQALSGSQAAMPTRKGRLDRWFTRLRLISRPLLLSLRNAFRRKSRLILTLITLTLGGAIFIATFNVQIALTDYIANIGKYFLADVNLSLARPYRISEIEKELAQVPGVGRVEGWAAARSELVLEDGSVGESVSMLAPPAGSPLVQPILISGRWVQPGDQGAIVLSERFASRFPDLREGDTLRLKVNGKDRNFTVVGFFQLAGQSGGYLSYTTYEYLSEIIGLPNQAATFRIVATQPNLSQENQERLGREIEAHLRRQGYQITEISQGRFLQSASSDGLTILTGFLLVMAGLTALVGSIGLAGTMSMNVMERTREIGVMRSIGATNRILMTLVITEGMVIGLVSWILASLLAFPISKLMSDIISISIFDAPTNFAFTPNGFIIWLVLVLILSVLASVVPARSAARMTIREVLAYE